jgi:alpha-beta hydrolase superfamily lysophospholipase
MPKNVSTHESNHEMTRPSVPPERHEGHFKGQYGDELFFQTWTSPAARASLILTHGISEHSDCYARTAEALVPMGWNIMAWDLRGHGRSSGKRGYVASFDDYSADLAHFIEFLTTTGRQKLSYALLGHSMGGLITLRYALDAGKNLKASAIALSSPLLGINVAVPPLKEMAAKFLRRFLPTATLFNEIRYEDLSRDKEVLKNYPTDSLRHEKVSPGIYFGILETTENVLSRASQLRAPLLLQAAGVDKVVSTEAAKRFFANAGSIEKKIIVYDESYHEIFNDLDRALVFEDLNRFLIQVFPHSQGGSST